MVEQVGGIIACKVRGVNLRKPAEIHNMYFRGKYAKGFATISIADENEKEMLQIQLNDDVWKILHILEEGEDT